PLYVPRARPPPIPTLFPYTTLFRSQGGAAVGASMQPKPYGVWGLMEKDLNALPGYGKAADDKAKARKLFAEAGYGPQNPLKIEMATRNIPIYVHFASFVINELKQVGVEATLKQADTAH